jgi:hydroxymethylpyrimidine/phosphomethylpyrimidine kinase
MYDNSEKFKVLAQLQAAVSNLEKMPNFFKLIPETKTNFVYSIERPQILMTLQGFWVD